MRVAIVAPLLVVFLGSLSIVVGALVGWKPFWPEPAMNVSEAAGVSNAGEVVRLIVVEGQDPNRAWPVRAGMLGSAPVTLTPLDAAIVIRREELVPLLVRHGVRLPESPAERTALICRAMAFEAAAIVELLLKTGDGSDPRDTCPKPAN
jgi:hypothetical protein